MAFLPKDEENQNAPQGQTTNNPQSSDAPPDTDPGLSGQGAGGSVGAGSSGPKAGGAPSIGTSTQFGSSASKLGDYLSANAPQITNQANTIAGNLNNQYGQVNQDITNAANQFQQQVQGGYTAANQDVVNQAKNNTTGFVQDPNNIKAFQNQYNNQYTGPQNFEGTDQYGNVQNEVNSAIQNANLLQSPAGLQSYLAGSQKNPTRASTTLDQLLLSGNPESQAKIQNAAKQFSGLGDVLGNTATGADQSVQDAQKAAQDSQAYARSQFDPYVQQFGTDLQGRLQQAQGQTNQYNTAVQGLQSAEANANPQLAAFMNALQAFNNNSIVQEASKQDSSSPFYGGWGLPTNVNIQDFQNPNTVGLPDVNQIATADDIAKQQALSQLLGTGYSGPLSAMTPGSFNVGEAPTLRSLIDPKLSQVEQNLANVKPNLWRGPGGLKTNNPYDDLQKQIASLKKYLGE